MRKILFSIACTIFFSTNAMDDEEKQQQKVTDWEIAHCTNNGEVLWAKLEELYKSIANKRSSLLQEREELEEILIDTENDDLIYLAGYLYEEFPQESFSIFLQRLLPKEISIESIENEEWEKIYSYINLLKQKYGNWNWDEILNWLFFQDSITRTVCSHCPSSDAEINMQDIVTTLYKMKADIRAWTSKRLEKLSLKIPSEFKEKYKAASLECLDSAIPLISRCKFSTSPVFSENIQKALDDCDKSIRDKIKNWYSDWFVLLNDINNANIIRRSYIESNDKVFANIGEEVQKLSRIPTNQEKVNLEGLIAIANKYGIKNVKMIDAESLINGYPISRYKKNALLYLLKYGSMREIYEEIDKFIEESHFDETGFKDVLNQKITLFSSLSSSYFPLKNITYKGFIRYALKASARYSFAYREEIVALIAWSRVSHPMLSELENFGSDILDMKRSASSRMKCNTKITNNGKTKRFDWCQVV